VPRVRFSSPPTIPSSFLQFRYLLRQPVAIAAQLRDLAAKR
jgi:hypothetical protein